MYTMKKYLAVLGRQPLISVAELESLYQNVQLIAPSLAEFETTADTPPDLDRLGGSLKIAEPITEPLPKFWQKLPDFGKISLGISDYSRGTNPYLTQREALKWKRVITKLGHNVRVVPNKTAILSSATSFHNKLFTDTHIELIKNGKKYYRVLAVQDINAYTKRDQARPARDAKVGMLPPKLAQILINLCGNMPTKSILLDPFCGTGVVLQEGLRLDFNLYGTDLNQRMIDYTRKNLEWAAVKFQTPAPVQPILDQGDAQNYQWTPTPDLIACETYLGPPMSQPPVDIKLKTAKQECRSIILSFLKNLASQIRPDTPVTIAVPAWLRPDGQYERLNILDEIENLRYNVVRFKNLRQKDLLYHRDGQVVAREIIVLRKK